jgi:hypothetical protein
MLVDHPFHCAPSSCVLFDNRAQPLADDRRADVEAESCRTKLDLTVDAKVKLELMLTVKVACDAWRRQTLCVECDD